MYHYWLKFTWVECINCLRDRIQRKIYQLFQDLETTQGDWFDSLLYHYIALQKRSLWGVFVPKKKQKKKRQSKTVWLTYRWHLIKYSYTITVVINNCWHKNIVEFSEYEEVISKYGVSKCKKPSLPLSKIKYTASLAFYQSKAIYIVDKE